MTRFWQWRETRSQQAKFARFVHRATESFWRLYGSLPKEVRDLADKNFALLSENPRHPSLHFKRIGEMWSARVGRDHRALALEHDDGLVWFWIGTHADYDRLIGRDGPAVLSPSVGLRSHRFRTTTLPAE